MSSAGRSHVLLVALAVCVALLGGAAWWLFVARPVQTLDDAGRVVEDAPAAATELADGGRAPATGAHASPELVDPQKGSQPNQRSAVTTARATKPTKPAASGLVIVAAESGEPLAGADVRFLRMDHERPASVDEIAELVRRTERDGKRVRSDGDGVASFADAERLNTVGRAARRVPENADCFVVAATKDRWGAGRVRVGSNGAKLALYRDGPLEVFVHDAGDRPRVGVPVTLAQFHERSRELARRADATSDERGRAVFEHGRAWLERERPAKLVLVADGAFAKVPRRDVTLDDLAAPVPLEVPPCGSIGITVLDFEGSKPARRAYVRLVSPELELAIGADPIAELADGREQFRAVEVGREARFEARLRIGEPLFGPFVGSVRLSSADEHVELVLGGPEAMPVVVVRVLDSDGTPCANQSLSVQWEARPAGAVPALLSPVSTDGEGRLKFFLAGWRAVDARGEFVGSVAANSPGESGLASGGALRLVAAPSGERKVRSAVLDVPLAPKLGLNELGDVKLLGLPLLVAGRVVDQIGAPIANANVNVLAQNSDGKTWRDTGAAALTDGDGRFSIDAEFPGAELAVRASASDSQRGAPVLFAPGISGVELPLERWARLDASAWIDPDLNPAELNVVWTIDGLSTALIGKPAPSDGGLTRAGFTHEKLRAGRGKLEVRAVSTSVLAYEPFELLPGPNPDALRDLDLRNLVRIVDLVIRDHEGRDVAAGEIRFRPSGSDEAWQSWKFSHGRARLLALAPELDLSIFGAPGRTTLFERVRDDATLVLDGPLWATLELAGGNPVRAPDTLKLAITLVDPRGVEVASALRGTWEALVDADGRAKVAFAAPGKHSIAFRVMHAASGGGRQLDETQTLDVQLVDREQSFALDAQRAAVERALAELADAASRAGGR